MSIYPPPPPVRKPDLIAEAASALDVANAAASLVKTLNGLMPHTSSTAERTGIDTIRLTALAAVANAVDLAAYVATRLAVLFSCSVALSFERAQRQ